MSRWRVWIDVLTPKQVLFFKPLADEFRSKGFEVFATSRRYREVEPMAKIAKFDLTYVGARGQKGRTDQLLADTRRQAEMIPLVGDFSPGIAVSLASGVCARVAFGMGIKHIAVNDSPHSEVAGRLSLPLSHRLLCPWIIPYSAWAKFGVSKEQITHYRALDPVVWLRRERLKGPVPRISSGRQTIVVRVEESDAPYLSGFDEKWADSVLQAIGDAFPEHNLVALCRYGHQLEEVKQKFGDRFLVPDEVVDGRALLEQTDLLIGMGGTMTAEAALSGVPAISAFQGSLMTEDYLESVGLLYRARDKAGLVRNAKNFLTPQFKKKYAAKSKRIFDSMEDPIPIMAGAVLKTLEQG